MKQIYNVVDYGAVAGSQELQTAKIQAAIDAAFLYFCDYPAKVIKPQGNIVIQNCVFEQPNSFFRLRWGQQWCHNRSLVDITFKNCKCTGVSLPIDLYCDENEPCTLRLEDVEISARFSRS